MEIYIDASEVRDLAGDIRRHADDAPAQAQLVVEKSAFDVEALGKIYAPVDTGHLMGSISSDVSELSYDVGPTADYGAAVELGVPHPFVIRAKKPGGSLHFVVDGRDVFVKSVVHPPMAPQPYMGPAFDEVLPRTISAFGDILDKSVSSS